MNSILLPAVLGLLGGNPGFVPPPGGIGTETWSVPVRMTGMGGVSVAVESPDGLSMANPAASAWAAATGVSWAAGWRSGDDEAWDDRLMFPYAGIVFPLPFRVVITAGLAERSRISAADTLYGTGYRGMYEWRGGLTEACAAVAVRTSDWLSVSIGTRGTFGSARSEVSIRSTEEGPVVPVTSEYLDLARLRPSWGLQLGVFLNTRHLDLGASVTTDRSGRILLERDFIAQPADSSDARYDIPGEVAVGLAVRPVDWLSVGTEYTRRKTLNLLESSTGEGSILAFGTEAALGRGFSARAGYSVQDGLWRDGARRMTAGLGYRFSRGTAGLDLAVTREEWDGLEENGLFLSVWSSERWLDGD